MAALLPPADGRSAPAAEDDRALLLTTGAPRRVRRVTGVLAALGTASAAIALLLDLDPAAGGSAASLSRGFAAAALLLGGLAAAAAAWNRRSRELPRRSVALVVLLVSVVIIYADMAIAYLTVAMSTRPFEDWVEGIPMALGAPIWAVGMVMIAWPPGMTVRDVILVIVDSVVSALALAVVWLLLVIPLEAQQVGDLSSFVHLTDPWSEYLAAVVIVTTAAVSRRSGSLPTGQLISLQAAVLLFVTSSLVGDWAQTAGYSSAISWGVLGYLAVVWVFRAFALGAAVQPEDIGQVRLRNIWSILVPFLPIPLAAVAVVAYRLRVGPIAEELLALTLLTMVAIVVANVILRLLISRDMVRMQWTKMKAPLSGGVDAQWFEAVLGDSRDVITVVDRDGSIVYQTPSASALIGLRAGALTGKHVADLFPDMSRRRFGELLVRASHSDADRGPYELTLRDVSGRSFDTETMITPLRTEGLDGFVLTTNDISDRRRLRAALVDSSTRDALTGLPNRDGFLARVREEIPSAGPNTVAVVLLDLNSFRDLNDSRGHEVGDEVLRAVAGVLERLPDTVRAFGRTGADEFGLLVAADPVVPEVASVERILRAALAGLVLANGSLVGISFALGFAARQQRTDTAGEVFEGADLALAAARGARSPASVGYRPEMRSELVARLRSEADLRDALDGDRVVVLYQPIVTLPDHRLVSVEALARLITPGGDVVGPAAFIPRAEELGLIGRLGLHVLDTALRDSNRISAAVGREIPVAVNVSASQVDDELPEFVAQALAAAGVPARRLVLELTESLLAEGHDAFGAVLDRIRAMGCQIALDDFGTGYSSLSYLAGLPVDLMKIDKSFVGRLGTSGDSFALVRTLLQLAQNLGLATVAEGVETVEQADILRGMNCTRAQGYLFARPMPLAELEVVLELGNGVLPVATSRGGVPDR